VAALCGLLGALAGSKGVAAAEGVTLRLNCPDLGPESSAAFEARARAELASSPRPAGEIAVACADRAAVVSWWAADGAFRELGVPLASDHAAAVEALLHAVEVLRAAVPSPPPAPAPGPEIGPARAAPEAPAVRASAAPHAWNGLGAAAGVDVERWQGAIGGAAGAWFGPRFSTPGRWSGALTAGVAWGAGSAEGVRARSLQAALAVGYAPLAYLEVALAAELRLLTATISATAGASELHDFTEAADVSARYVVALGPVRLAAGPRVGVLAHPFLVELAGRELFRVPAVVVGFVVEGATALGR
jgi:hypothetical protein